MFAVIPGQYQTHNTNTQLEHNSICQFSYRPGHEHHPVRLVHHQTEDLWYNRPCMHNHLCNTAVVFVQVQLSNWKEAGTCYPNTKSIWKEDHLKPKPTYICLTL